MKPVSIIWQTIDDLTIYHAAFWLCTNLDPSAHEYRIEHDLSFEDHLYERGAYEDIWDTFVPVILSAIRTEKIRISGQPVVKSNQELDGKKTRIHKADWLNWCLTKPHFAYIADAFNVNLEESEVELEREKYPPQSIDKLETNDTSENDGTLPVPTLESELPRGLTTSVLLSCLGGYIGVEDPAKVLSGYPDWAMANGALMQRGRPGRPSHTNPDVSEWNPVQFALNLFARKPLPTLAGIGKLHAKHIDTVFEGASLSAWKPIWQLKRPAVYR
jgi:hypothetical protein